MSGKTLPQLHKLPFMTPWYGPRALTQTGLRAAISHTIGNYADQRIMQAASDDVSNARLLARYDYSELPGTAADSLDLDADGGLWIDYMADTGDGFDSTYAMASLLAMPELKVDGCDRPLPAGRILFLGGDQAYPFASLDQYEKRFLQAFDLTTWHGKPEPDAKKPRRAFVLPGNHDWYDGLSSFDRLFCRQRDGVSEPASFGPYQCRQHRSYWAVKLPHDWWVWGLDIQLTASLDVGQIQYFTAIARTLHESRTRSKIIICLPTPAWMEGAASGNFDDYQENLKVIVNIAIERATVCLMVSGDWHHYARYFSPAFKLNVITAGGGGAYLAPTHLMPSTLDVPWVKPEEARRIEAAMGQTKVDFTLNAPTSTEASVVTNASHQPRPEALYPPRRISRKLSWQILAFPLWNPTFCLALGGLYFLMYWFYTSVVSITPICPSLTDATRPFCATLANKTMRMDTILLQAKSPLSPLEQFQYLFASSRYQPFLGFTLLAVLGLIWGFLAGSKDRLAQVAESVAFWLFHVFLMAYMSQAILWAAFHVPWVKALIGERQWLRIAGTSAFMWLVGGVLAGLMCGIYLFLGNRVFKTHEDNAFSAIRIPGYKNFLRMRITKDELVIYPIGLDKVPHRTAWRPVTAEEAAASGNSGGFRPRVSLAPHLIEGPIVIRPGDIVQMS